MNPTRQSKQDDLKAVLQHRAWQAELGPDELIAERLVQLQAFISQLADTPHGREEIRRRIERFGECTRRDDETANQFHGRLRRWLDRDLEILHRTKPEEE